MFVYYCRIHRMLLFIVLFVLAVLPKRVRSDLMESVLVSYWIFAHSPATAKLMMSRISVKMCILSQKGFVSLVEGARRLVVCRPHVVDTLVERSIVVERVLALAGDAVQRMREGAGDMCDDRVIVGRVMISMVSILLYSSPRTRRCVIAGILSLALVGATFDEDAVSRESGALLTKAVHHLPTLLGRLFGIETSSPDFEKLFAISGDFYVVLYSTAARYAYTVFVYMNIRSCVRRAFDR